MHAGGGDHQLRLDPERGLKFVNQYKDEMAKRKHGCRIGSGI